VGITSILLGFICALMLRRFAWAWALGFIAALEIAIPWFAGQLPVDVLYDPAAAPDLVRKFVD